MHPRDTGEHFHVAFGVYNCDKWLANVQSNSETPGDPITEQYKVTGIHSHADGVIHVHPFGSAGAGKNAKLGTYLKLVNAKISNTKLEMPEGLGTLSTDDKCGDKKTKLKTLVWDDAAGRGTPASISPTWARYRSRRTLWRSRLCSCPKMARSTSAP